MRVLIVEDDEDTATFVCQGLTARGHEIELAKTGREGLALALTARFDVVALDRMLPEIDGLGVVSAMRSSAVSTPVLFLTNLSGIDDRVDGLDVVVPVHQHGGRPGAGVQPVAVDGRGAARLEERDVFDARVSQQAGAKLR